MNDEHATNGVGPRVTLAMPVYNGERYIREAIDSLLGQTFPDFELVITDNASEDATRDICEAYAASDSRVRYVRNPENLGAAKNYNRGYELSRGEYLKWCAHDDIVSENYVEACVEALDSVPTASVAFGQTITIDDDGEIIPEDRHDWVDAVELLDPVPRNRFLKSLRTMGTCFPIFGLFRKSMLDKTSLHRPFYGSDRTLLSETALLGEWLRVEQAVFYNRDHRKRSMRIVDPAVRAAWQNGQASRLATASRISLAMHLWEIAGRHPDLSPVGRTRMAALSHIVEPGNLRRYAPEVVRLVAPGIMDLIKGRRASANQDQ